MRGDIPEVAFRLLTALPVTTHESRPLRATEKVSRQLHHYRERRRLAMEAGYSRKARAVIIGGKTYATKKEVMQKLKISSATFYEWIATGRAKRG